MPISPYLLAGRHRGGALFARATLLSLVLLALGAPVPVAAQGDLGPIYRVSPLDAGPQDGPALVVGARGEAAYLWFGLCPDFDLCHRAYDALGAPTTEAAPLATGSPLLDALPAIALAADGGLVAVWSEPGLGFERRIAGRRFTFEGAPLGAPFIVASVSAQVYDRPDLAVAPDGDLLVTFERLRFDGFLGEGEEQVPVYTGVEILARRLSPTGSPRGPAFGVDGPTLDEVSSPTVAVGGGEILVAWESFSGIEQILTRRFSDAANPLPLADEEALTAISPTARRSEPSAAASAQGTFFIAWTDVLRPGVQPRVLGQVLDEDRKVFPLPFAIDDVGSAPRADGGDDVFAVTWVGSLPDDGLGVKARRYDALGVPLDAGGESIDGFPPGQVLTPDVGLFAGARLDSGMVFGWRVQDEELSYAVFGRRAAGVLPPPPPCVDGPRTLCLGAGDRFEVEVVWSTETPAPNGASGTGQRVELTADTGYFWFFRDTNVEMVVKVLDGCGVNGRHWVFAGGLTDRGVEMTVRDTATGASAVYSNPLGTAFQPIQDTAAFPCP